MNASLAHRTRPFLSFLFFCFQKTAETSDRFNVQAFTVCLVHIQFKRNNLLGLLNVKCPEMEFLNLPCTSLMSL